MQSSHASKIILTKLEESVMHHLFRPRATAQVPLIDIVIAHPDAAYRQIRSTLLALKERGWITTNHFGDSFYVTEQGTAGFYSVTRAA